MLAIRRLLANRQLAILVCAAALVLKVLIPTGYMLSGSGGDMAVTVCSGTTSVPMAMPDMPDHGKTMDHGKAEMPCAFASLSAASLAATDAIQLAVAIAFVMAVGITARLGPPPCGQAHLRPPLRGPPAHR